MDTTNINISTILQDLEDLNDNVHKLNKYIISLIDDMKSRFGKQTENPNDEEEPEIKPGFSFNDCKHTLEAVEFYKKPRGDDSDSVEYNKLNARYRYWINKARKYGYATEKKIFVDKINKRLIQARAEFLNEDIPNE